MRSHVKIKFAYYKINKYYMVSLLYCATSLFNNDRF